MCTYLKLNTNSYNKHMLHERHLFGLNLNATFIDVEFALANSNEAR